MQHTIIGNLTARDLSRIFLVSGTLILGFAMFFLFNSAGLSQDGLLASWLIIMATLLISGSILYSSSVDVEGPVK